MIPVPKQNPPLISLAKGFNLQKEINDINASNLTASPLRDRILSIDEDVRAIAISELERRLILNQGRCDETVVDALRIQTFQLSPGQIDRFVNTSTGSYDSVFQDGMGCLVDGMVSSNTGFPDARLRRWVTNYNKIGGPSSGGMAFALNNVDYTLFAVKVPLRVTRNGDISQTEDLSHEAFVGMAALNNLRSKIPTFVHTYGAFSCTAPFLDVDSVTNDVDVITWCSGSNSSIRYLVLEYIENSVSLADISSKLSPEEFLQIYLQVINAVNVANKEYDFTHFDLHSGNVLLQKLSKPISVPLYMKDGSIKHIITNYLARIIDFGMSHVEVQGYSFGLYGLEDLGVNPSSSFPMTDAYKLLLQTYNESLNMSARAITDNSRSLLTNIVQEIYDYFEEGVSVNTRIMNRNHHPSEDYYQLDNEEYIDVSLDELIEHIMSVCDTSFVHDDIPHDVTNTICDNKCISWDTFTQTIFDQTRLPQTFEDNFHALEVLDRIKDPEHKKNIMTWLESFDVNVAFTQEYPIWLDKLNMVHDIIEKVDLPSPPPPVNLAPRQQMLEYDRFGAEYDDVLKRFALNTYELKECKIWSTQVLFVLKYLGKIKQYYVMIANFRETVRRADDKIHVLQMKDTYNLKNSIIDPNINRDYIFI